MRKIPCPYCTGEVLAIENGRTSSSAALFPRLQNVLIAISDMISAILGGSKTVSKKQALGGKCRTCGDTGVIEDVTDTSEQQRAAEAVLRGYSDRILELETKAIGNSPGGNMVRRVAGAKVEIVGRTLNTAKSYTVHKGKGAFRTGGKVTKDGRAPEGPEKGKGGNVITGNNPPANTGGGLYYIQCGNKFKLVAGAQGIDLTSNGPINIDGGMVRFTGAEVTLGSKAGPVILDGDTVSVASTGGITLAPGQGSIAGDSTGQKEKDVKAAVSICSPLYVSGNVNSGGLATGHAFIEAATMPEKQETTKISSGGDLINGPAQWAPTLLAPTAVKNFVKWAIDSATDVVLAGAMNPLNPRSMLKMKDNAVNLLYSALPRELVPTGECEIGIPGIGNIKGLIYNYPHCHSTPDEVHSHNVSMPAINFKGHSAETVRGEADAAGINTGIPAASTGGAGDWLTKVVGGVTGAFKALTGAFATDGHKITGGSA